MSVKRRTILVAALVFGFVAVQSCVKVVDLVAEEVEPTVVVECVLDNSTEEQTLRLGLTKGRSKDSYGQIESAVAVLYDLTESRCIGEFSHAGGGCWTLEYVPIADHEYKLEVDIDGHEHIWAQCVMPPPVECCHIEGSAFQIGLVFDDYVPGHEHEYDPDRYVVDRSHNPSDLPEKYHFTNGTCYKLRPSEARVSVRWFRLDESTGERVYAKSIATDIENVREDNIDGANYPGESLRITARTIFSDYMWYVVPYPTVCGRPFLDGRLVFDAKDALSQCQYFTVSVGVKDTRILSPLGGYKETVKDAFIIVESTPSVLEEYYRRIDMMLEKRESPDYESVFLRDNVPSNINGGIGVFSGQAVQILPWELQYSLWYESEKLVIM